MISPIVKPLRVKDLGKAFVSSTRHPAVDDIHDEIASIPSKHILYSVNSFVLRVFRIPTQDKQY